MTDQPISAAMELWDAEDDPSLPDLIPHNDNNLPNLIPPTYDIDPESASIDAILEQLLGLLDDNDMLNEENESELVHDDDDDDDDDDSDYVKVSHENYKETNQKEMGNALLSLYKLHD